MKTRHPRFLHAWPKCGISLVRMKPNLILNLALSAIAILFLPACAGLTQNWLPDPNRPAPTAAESERQILAGMVYHVSFVPFDAKSAPPANAAPDPDAVSIFTEKPDRPFKEVGALNVQIDQPYETLARLLQYRASQAGADGIVKFKTEDVTVGIKGEQRRTLQTQHKASGIAVKFLS
jgi:hypothetical protein